MPTPTFEDIPSNLLPIRFYTETDAYHFTVDNRPLEDLYQNVSELIKAADAARRAGLIEAVSTTAFQAWFTGAGEKFIGFPARNISTGIVGLGAGILISNETLAVGGTEVVSKKAPLLAELELSVPFPFNGGKERKHLIQVRYVDFGTGQPFPYEDLTNEYLASSVINGKLEVSVVSSGEVDEGTGVVPTPTAGWLPMYSVTCVYGETTSAIAKVAGVTWYDEDFFSIIDAKVAESEANAIDAQTALDAILGTQGVYETSAEGIAATVDGEFFSVPSLDSHEYIVLYKNVSGVATEIKRYPSAVAVQTSLITSGIFSTAENGLAATTDGKYFSVPSNDASESVIIYRNNAGVATEVKRYPSASRFDAVVAHTTSEANRAESARDVSQLAAGIYETTAAGITGTVNGEYFTVPSPDTDESVIIYRNVSGVATEIKRYPSAAMIDSVALIGTQVEVDASQVAADVIATAASAAAASSSASNASTSEINSAASASASLASEVASGLNADAASVSEANSAASAAAAANSASAAALSAGGAALSAEDSYASFLQAEALTAQASVYATRAESARDAAQVAVNIFADAASGLAGTEDGEYFSVIPPTTDDYLILYVNDSGIATELRRYPTSQFLIDTAADVQEDADAARDYANAYLEKMAGLSKLYLTYAAAVASAGTLTAGDVVMVISDETHEGNSAWYQVSGGSLVFIKEDSSIRLVSAPSNQNGSGADGYVAVDADYLYVAVGNNSWKRVPLGWDTFKTVNLGNTVPLALGTATPGVSPYVSRADHVHAMPSAADIGAEVSGAAAAAKTYAVQRSNHTGEQAISTITGLQDALDDIDQRLDNSSIVVTTHTAGSAVTLSVDDYSFRTLTLNQPTCTLTLEANPAYFKESSVRQVTLKLIQGTGANKVVWPTSVRWPYGREAVLSFEEGRFDLVTLTTLNNGLTWIAAFDGGWMNE